jgi:hypothetical protein
VRRVFLAAIVVVAACDSVLGIEELPNRASLVRETAECGTCGSQSCAPERDACFGDPGCRDLYACVAPCGESDVGGPACRRACETKSTASSAAAWLALDQCRRLNCADECYGFRGFGQIIDPACACSDDICEAFLKRCVRSGVTSTTGERLGDCERRIACLGSRPKPIDPDDAFSCTYETRGGQDELQLVRFCWQGAACDEKCPVAGGKMFACIGKYQWSRPALDEVPYTLTVNDRRGLPVAGALVEVCDSDDCDACRNPRSSYTTKADGLAHLKVSMFGGGYRGCMQITAAGKLPTIWYTGRPVNRSEWLQRALVVSREDLQQVTGGIGEPADPTKGQVMVGTRDCLVTPAAGVMFDPPTAPGAFPVYIRLGTPTREGPTDDSGQYAIGNVPAGPLTIVMRDTKGNELGRSTVRVRAGWVTGTYVFPSSLPD